MIYSIYVRLYQRVTMMYLYSSSTTVMYYLYCEKNLIFI
jgi:hypothetical protein